MLKKLWNKKNDKKGFTLVELIVVLIILAILAALLIPALTGYIDKAKNKQIVAETRQAVMAAQTIADEMYAAGNAPTELQTGATDKFTAEEIKELAEVKGTVISATVSGGKITELVYQNGKFCTYTENGTNGTDGVYNVTDTQS